MPRIRIVEYGVPLCHAIRQQMRISISDHLNRPRKPYQCNPVQCAYCRTGFGVTKQEVRVNKVGPAGYYQ